MKENTPKQIPLSSWGSEDKEKIPPQPMSILTTQVTKTGAWRYLKPVYTDRLPPCTAACPAGEDISGQMKLAQEGKLIEAWKLLRMENPFPAICGRVCFHPCESKCNRAKFDSPVSINGIERFIGELGLENFEEVENQKKQIKKRKAKVVVIGAGPAGLSAAYHLALLGYMVKVFDSQDRPGGILATGIPPYRLPKEIVEKEVELIKKIGVEIVSSCTVGRDISWEELEKYDAIVIASGAHQSRKMNISGEELEGVENGLDFLKKINTGQKPQVGEIVGVVGGGNTAIDTARSSRRLGAQVTIYYRRTREEMPANEEEVEAALKEGIEIVFLKTPSKIHKTQDGKLKVTFQKMVLGEPDETGRRRPIPAKGETEDVVVDNLLIAIGEATDLSYLPDEVDTKKGSITVNELCQSSVEKIFAAGDVIDQPRTVAHAIGSGKRAAIGVDRFLREKTGEIRRVKIAELTHGIDGNLSMARYKNASPIYRENFQNDVVKFEDTNIAYFIKEPRNERNQLEGEERLSGFKEVVKGLDKDAAIREINRCFICGLCTECQVCMIFCPDATIEISHSGHHLKYNYDYCKGCGLCARECPRGCIKMVFE